MTAAREPESDIDRVAVGAATGDAEMIARLLAVIRPMLVRYCRARLGRSGDSYREADDVAQEVGYAVLASVPAYSGGPFLRHMHEIAANIVDELEPMTAGGGSELSDLLPKLPALDRDVVVLRVATGLSTAETATILRLSPGEIRVAQHRALTRLRGLL